ncbi:uncharacterized protein LOC100905279 [Galendromus occidentalis]|uniref:Uncharacterized protein LOC100905279 n=1 Tax=Galendromus occidentalis TaxID=34638 RepID=A0AAJ6VX59_9ACAR|nr:uncharacterized protein LOC100905279 [Galendromus occidentalis]
MEEKRFDPERRQNIACMLSSARPKDTQRIFFEEKFSSWIKAVRFWALMQRLIRKAQGARDRVSQGISFRASPPQSRDISFNSSELISARLSLIQLIQKSYFKEEFESSCKSIKRDSPIYQYNPFIDESGIIRCKSRLERSPHLSGDQEFPIILPGNCNLSRLIVQDIHERRCYHFGGMNMILQLLREDFLLIHARKIARQVLKTCARCRIFHSEAANLPSPPLPPFRLEEAPPFYHTGCDFMGPIRYKKDSGEVGKSYILLMTCAVSRAIHLELTSDLSTVEVLGALQKINRFPAVQTITSDNGLSFQRAARELKLIYEHIKDGEIKRWLANSFIEWRFQTAAAPWFGAILERQVQTVKRPLRKILGSAIPHFRDLEIIISGIEAMVNSRPITAVASGADEVEALSPANLLFGYKGKTIIPEHLSKPKRSADFDKVVFSRRWKYQQRLLSSFWRRYHEEYLQYLKTAHKQNPTKARPLKIGDVCLLQGENFNRALWPLCRVISFPENIKPENARSCFIKTAKGQTLNRPIRKLYPLEA